MDERTHETVPKENTSAQSKNVKKDRRVQLVVLPQDWEDFMALSHLVGSTPNALLCGFIHETVTANADRIKKFKAESEEARRSLGFVEEKKGGKENEQKRI